MGHERGSARIAATTAVVVVVMMIMSMVFHSCEAAAPPTTTNTTTPVVAVKWDLNVTNQYPHNTLELKKGDTLVFNYTTSLHNLVQVTTLDAYTNCDNSSAINTYTTGNNTFPVNGEGTQYFICGVSNHCKDFKMKLTVTASST